MDHENNHSTGSGAGAGLVARGQETAGRPGRAEAGATARAPRKTGEDRIDFRRLVHLLRDNTRLLVLCVLCGGLAVLACTMEAPVFYASTAVLEVAEDENSFTGFNRPGGSDLNSASLLKTIEQTVASQTVLRRVLEKQRLAEDPTFAPPRETGPYSEAELLERIQKRVQVSLVRGTRLITLAAWDPDPVKAQRIAQGVIDEFFLQKLQLNRDGADAARRYLNAEASRVKNELTASEERLQLYRENYNGVSLSERHNLVMARLDDLSAQVTRARADRLALETEKAQVEALRNDASSLLSIRSIAALPEVIELTKQLNTLGPEVSALRQRYRDKHPRLIEMTRQLEQTRAALRETARRAGEAIVQSHRMAKANEEMLQREFDQQEKLALELSRVSIPYRTLEREAESNQALYQQMLARLKEADVTQGLLTAGRVEGSRIRVVQQPLVPVRPDGLSKEILLALGLLGGGAVGLGLMLVQRALDDSLDSVDEAEAWLGLPSLAVIHRSSLRGLRSEPVIDAHPATIEAEAFRSLRTALSLLPPEERGRVVMFTSALPGEGKSFCALNHAAALAQQGLRTVLVDGDLRRAWLRSALAPDSGGPGLADCLADPSLLSSAFQRTKVDKLFVLGDRRGSTKGVALLSGPNLAALIERCRADFDRVVVDTAPVTAVGDALHFARHVDTTCLVVRAGVTPRRTARRARVLIESAAGRPPAGIVLNRVRRSRCTRYYYYSVKDYGEKPVRTWRGIRALAYAFSAASPTHRP